MNKQFLQERTNKAINRGFPKPKWIEFCEVMIDLGFKLHMYEARKTVSKYITVINGDKKFKVRFSNHRPIKERESNGDCDFFVGITNFKVTNTDQAIEAVKKFMES